jgi:hypothetical protein
MTGLPSTCMGCYEADPDPAEHLAGCPFRTDRGTGVSWADVPDGGYWVSEAVRVRAGGWAYESTWVPEEHGLYTRPLQPPDRLYTELFDPTDGETYR